MRTAFRVLSYIIAVEVVIQAAAIAFATFGLGKWIEDGGVLDKAVIEDQSASFTGVLGFAIHAINGQMVIPLLAVVLFIVSFFAKVPGGVKWAGAILALVVAQVMLGIFGHGIPALGPLHGITALILFAVAGAAGDRASSKYTGRVSAAQGRTAPGMTAQENT